MDALNNKLDEIRIQVDAEAAKAYKTASSDERRKIQILLSNWLKQVTLRDKTSLKQLMNEISDNAQARGLTPEILETILSETE